MTKKKSHDKFAPKILHIPENIPYQTKEPTNRMKSGIEWECSLSSLLFCSNNVANVACFRRQKSWLVSHFSLLHLFSLIYKLNTRVFSIRVSSDINFCPFSMKFVALWIYDWKLLTLWLFSSFCCCSVFNDFLTPIMCVVTCVSNLLAWLLRAFEASSFWGKWYFEFGFMIECCLRCWFWNWLILPTIYLLNSNVISTPGFLLVIEMLMNINH